MNLILKFEITTSIPQGITKHKSVQLLIGSNLK